MNHIKLAISVTIIAVMVFIASGFNTLSVIKAEHQGKIITCSSIGDYDLAQVDLALYKSDPEKYPQYRRLDGFPKDGIACNLLKLKK